MAKKAYKWYEKQQAGLGDSFLFELEHCYDKIESSPLLCAKIHNDYRHAILRTFPYVIVFEIIKNEVVVYTVFHTSRNPRKKFRK
jgi:plasmid stabilization system protein ParE